MSHDPAAAAESDLPRRRAEERLRARPPTDTPLERSHEENVRLVHELQVHQIEIEIQNEELRDTRAALEAELAERRLTEQRLRVSEERFRLMSQVTHDAIWDWNLVSGAIWRNENYTTLFGYPADEMAPDISWWQQTVHPDDRAEVVAGLQAAIARGDATWSDEYRLTRRDGSIAHVFDRGCILLNEHGKAVRVVGGITDVTERKQLEERFLRAQRLESIGTLAAGVAHNLNNALAPILMSLDLLKMQTVSPEARELLDIMESSARHGADVVREVLSFARGMLGERLPLSIEALVHELEKLVRDTFPRDLQLRVSIPDGLWNVIGDRTQLHQVLLNLCVNARDAMPGGGSLRLAVENRQLDAFLVSPEAPRRSGPYVVLRVEDSGCGMSAEVQARIFDPFYTTKAFGQGSGLGLSTALGIVQSHGGFLQITSEPGQGTQCAVFLPAVVTAELAQMPTPPATEISKGHGELILLVDDEPAVRIITGQTLEAFGYRVLVASNGAEALALYARQSEEIAAVLIDLMMPVMDGEEAIRALLRLNPELPIVASTGVPTSDPADKVRSLRVRAFLPKPCSAAEMIAALRAAIGGVNGER